MYEWLTGTWSIILPKSLKDLTKYLVDRNIFRKNVRMIAILFARPESSLSKTQILPFLPYLDNRSEQHIDFYLPGYELIEYGSQNDTVVAEIEGNQWTFSYKLFNSFRKELEIECKWEYSGATDLLLLNAHESEGVSRFDYGSAICCQLEDMIACKAIDSLDKFFERIIRHAESFDGTDPTWGFSDRMGMKVGVSALKRVVLSLLPKNLSTEVQQAAHYAVQDLRYPD